MDNTPENTIVSDSAPRGKVPLAVRLRSLLFIILYSLAGAIHGLLCLLVFPFLAFPRRYAFANIWTRVSMWLLKVINGVSVEITGQENIADGEPLVVLANHQSQWETFYLLLVVVPQATLLKQELLKIPFFGWALARLKPIPIDRRKPTQAMKTVLRKGSEYLAEGISVVIYPEGTRQPPGSLGTFNTGGAMLACRAKVRVLPIVHNSGDCWPARSLLRLPGTIRLVIGPPIDTAGKTPKEVNQEAARWIRENYPHSPD